MLMTNGDLSQATLSRQNLLHPAWRFEPANARTSFYYITVLPNRQSTTSM